jgi:hypothetical protein
MDATFCSENLKRKFQIPSNERLVIIWIFMEHVLTVSTGLMWPMIRFSKVLIVSIWCLIKALEFLG